MKSPHESEATENRESVIELSRHEAKSGAAVEAALKKQAEDIAKARQDADGIIEKARQKAAKYREGAIAAAKEKLETEKKRIMEEAQKDAAKIRASKAASSQKTADTVFGKALSKYFE